jgi:hypothetical protein
MGIEALFIEVTLKAAAGNFGKKLADVILSYPLLDRMKSMLPFNDRERIDDFSRGKITAQDIDLIRQHITKEDNEQEFKALAGDAFNLSDGDLQLLMQHLKALNDNIGGHQEMVDQHARAESGTEGQRDDMRTEAREKITYHEEQALKLLELRH